MITIRLIGGLGNQIFQFAAAYAFAKKLNCPIVLDTSSYSKDVQHGGYRLDNYVLPENITSCNAPKYSFNLLRLVYKFPILIRILGLKIVHESESSFDNLDGNFLLGYWQDSSYFKSVKADLSKVLTPKNIPGSASKIALKVRDKNSVSIHVRRGDYISNDTAQKVHGSCSLSYYMNAITTIKQKLESPYFVIFSNDINWTRENLHSLLEGTEYEFMENNTQETDLWLMNQMKHHIIANSSFSWWGAYLASNPDQIVISPTPWYNTNPTYSNDPSLNEWIRLNK